jgi:hypothetical protein
LALRSPRVRSVATPRPNRRCLSRSSCCSSKSSDVKRCSKWFRSLSAERGSTICRQGAAATSTMRCGSAGDGHPGTAGNDGVVVGDGQAGTTNAGAATGGLAGINGVVDLLLMAWPVPPSGIAWSGASWSREPASALASVAGTALAGPARWRESCRESQPPAALKPPPPPPPPLPPPLPPLREGVGRCSGSGGVAPITPDTGTGKTSMAQAERGTCSGSGDSIALPNSEGSLWGSLLCVGGLLPCRAAIPRLACCGVVHPASSRS